MVVVINAVVVVVVYLMIAAAVQPVELDVFAVVNMGAAAAAVGADAVAAWAVALMHFVAPKTFLLQFIHRNCSSIFQLCTVTFRFRAFTHDKTHNFTCTFCPN